MEKQKVGFALASPAVRRTLGAHGGRTAHARGTAHKWDKDTAVEAGRKGGLAGAARRRLTAVQPERIVTEVGVPLPFPVEQAFDAALAPVSL